VRSEPMPVASGRWAWVEIDLDALSHNVTEIAAQIQGSDIWAVVKADGYGHGASRIAATAIESGVRGLCVALISEAEQLRAEGITAPILLLSQQPPELIPRIIAADAIPTVDTAAYVDLLAAALPEGAGYGIPDQSGYRHAARRGVTTPTP
jgi:alanine racemase